jgi:hypothetical protein
MADSRDDPRERHVPNAADNGDCELETLVVESNSSGKVGFWSGLTDGR